MASAIRKTTAKAVGSNSLGPDRDGFIDPRDTAKYLLRVTAGPSYDASTHDLVHVNGDAYNVDNEYMTASINIRIRDYHGLPKTSPPTHEYFSHSQHRYDRYSISFSFTPKKDIPGEEVIMGFDFDRPIRDRLPPLFKPALKLVTTVIDPGIYCDAYADKPYIYGAALSSFFLLRIGDKSAPGSRSPSRSRKSSIVQEGGDGSGSEIRKRLGVPENSEKRRKFYLKKQNLDNFAFEAGREYEADFFNPYLDFANFAVRLPGFSISVARYIDDKTHELRYVLKNRKTDEVYFVIVFTLLFGQELKDALKAERARLGEPEPETVERKGRSSEEEAEDEEVESRRSSGEPEQQEGLIASLSRWMPRIMRSASTATGSSTSSQGSPERSSSSFERQVEHMSDQRVEDLLREKQISA